jgi:hypothetical protein
VLAIYQRIPNAILITETRVSDAETCCGWLLNKRPVPLAACHMVQCLGVAKSQSAI